MEDFYIGGAALTRPAATLSPRMGGAGGEGLNFTEIVDLALPAEGVFHNLVFVSIRKTYPMQAYKVLADGHHARPLGHGPDDVHQIHRRGGRRRGCA